MAGGNKIFNQVCNFPNPIWRLPADNFSNENLQDEDIRNNGKNGFMLAVLKLHNLEGLFS